MDAVVEAAYWSWPAMRDAYVEWRRCGIREDTGRLLAQYASELHAMHLEEFKRELNVHGAPQRLMMQRQMIAELEDELRKRDEPIWANAAPGD